MPMRSSICSVRADGRRLLETSSRLRGASLLYQLLTNTYEVGIKGHYYDVYNKSALEPFLKYNNTFLNYYEVVLKV